MAKISLNVTHELKIVNQASCEFMVSQLQKYTDVILVVRDGYEVILVRSAEDLPRDLKFDMIKYNEECRTTEFHYRDQDEDELWVFFHPHVHQWLQNNRHGPLKIGWIVRGDASRLDHESKARASSSVKVKLSDGRLRNEDKTRRMSEDYDQRMAHKPSDDLRIKAERKSSESDDDPYLSPISVRPHGDDDDSESDENSFTGLTLDVYESVDPEIPVREYVATRRRTPLIGHEP